MLMYESELKTIIVIWYMANPPLDECHKVENWSNLKLI